MLLALSKDGCPQRNALIGPDLGPTKLPGPARRALLGQPPSPPRCTRPGAGLSGCTGTRAPYSALGFNAPHLDGTGPLQIPRPSWTSPSTCGIKWRFRSQRPRRQYCGHHTEGPCRSRMPRASGLPADTCISALEPLTRIIAVQQAVG